MLIIDKNTSTEMFKKYFDEECLYEKEVCIKMADMSYEKAEWFVSHLPQYICSLHMELNINYDPNQLSNLAKQIPIGTNRLSVRETNLSLFSREQLADFFKSLSQTINTLDLGNTSLRRIDSICILENLAHKSKIVSLDLSSNHLLHTLKRDDESLLKLQWAGLILSLQEFTNLNDLDFTANEMNSLSVPYFDLTDLNQLPYLHSLRFAENFKRLTMDDVRKVINAFPTQIRTIDLSINDFSVYGKEWGHFSEELMLNGKILILEECSFEPVDEDMERDSYDELMNYTLDDGVCLNEADSVSKKNDTNLVANHLDNNSNDRKYNCSQNNTRKPFTDLTNHASGSMTILGFLKMKNSQRNGVAPEMNASSLINRC